MQLKSLELYGFKSFPDRTIIDFNDGLTAVVGPNGCGKSNISDAIRWVLGEQSTKNLRGQKMEDVIFTGTQKRNSVGHASVTLTIDNKSRLFSLDEDIVKIRRKYYRNGESEYYINNKNVRLKDVNELLMDTGLGKEGFSMISQGKIADIISSKSKDRREFFETAAGISKFRHRKDEAIKSLLDADENIIRLNDILAELKSRLKPLEIQSKKAKEFVLLSNEKKTLDIFITLNTIDDYSKKIKDIKNTINTISQEYSVLEQEIKEADEQIKIYFDKSNELQMESSSHAHKKELNNQEKTKIVSEIAVLKNNILHYNNDFSNNETKLVEYKKSTDEFNLSIEGKENEIKVLEGKLLNVTSLHDENVSLIDELTNKLLAKLKSFDEINLFIDSLEQELNKLSFEYKFNIKSREASIEKYNELEKKIEAYNKSIVSYKESINEVNSNIMLKKDDLESVNNSIQGIKLQLDAKVSEAENFKNKLQTTYISLKDNQNKLRVLNDLNNSLEGFSKSVKAVINASNDNKITGVFGTVSMLVNTKDYLNVAIETALGYSLQNIVVVDEFVAKNGVNYLKNGNLGRATFMPLTSVKGSILDVKNISKENGFIGLAVNLVEYSQRFNEIFNYLLGRIIIIDNIDNGADIAKKYMYKFKIVTLDGQVINSGGTFTGGSTDKGLAPLSRKSDIKKLNIDIKNQEDELKNIKQLVSDKKEQTDRLNELMSEFILKKENILNSLTILESKENNLNYMLEQNTIKLNEDSSILKVQSEQSSAFDFVIQDISKQIEKKELEVNDLIDQRTRMNQENNQINIEKQETKDRVTKLIMDKLDIVKDIELIKQAHFALKDRKDNASLQIKVIINTQHEINQKIKQINSSILDLNDKCDALDKENEKISSSIHENDLIRQENEKQTIVLRNKANDIAIEKERLSNSISRIQEQEKALQKDYDSLIAMLFDEYGLTRSEAISLNIQIDDTANANIKLSHIKNKIKELGVVNLSAIEEYEEVKHRFVTLSEQLDDINKSKKGLQKLIEDLTLTMTNQFLESFTIINKNFSKIFVDLFGGGTAYLKLSESESALDSGIDIFVSPPGKIVKNLSMLSGGEQAFIAIAVYFALLQKKPAPFCVLDEIEAALDEVNVVKYARYLRQLSDKTQFILITHRRGTMEEADTLYGVTMQDEGVSRILKLDSN